MDKIIYLGIQYNIEYMTNLKIEKKLVDVRKLIQIWKPGALTIFGKLTLMRSVFISKFTHIMLFLPIPEYIISKHTALVDFLWDGKPPK